MKGDDAETAAGGQPANGESKALLQALQLIIYGDTQSLEGTSGWMDTAVTLLAGIDPPHHLLQLVAGAERTLGALADDGSRQPASVAFLPKLVEKIRQG